MRRTSPVHRASEAAGLPSAAAARRECRTGSSFSWKMLPGPPLPPGISKYFQEKKKQLAILGPIKISRLEIQLL